MQSHSAPLAIADGPYCELDALLRLRAFATSLQLTQPRRVRSQLSGTQKSNVRGRGIEFEEVRSYTPGDDVRNIDWRVTARTGKTHTKLFREERERPVYLMVDQRTSMFFGSRRTLKSVQAVYAAALLAWATLDQGDRIGGMVFDDHEHHELRPRRSRRTVIELLRSCHRLNQRLGIPDARERTLPRLGLADALSNIRRVARPGSLVLLVSDFRGWNDDCERQLHLLSRHCEIGAIQIYDTLESSLPSAGRGIVSDGVRRLGLDTSNTQLRSQYAAAAASRQEALAAALRSIGAPLIRLGTHEAVLEVLARHYRPRKGR